MTINFDLSYVLYGGAITVSLGLLVAIVRWLRKVETPPIPGWGLLMITGLSGFGFAVSDMPSSTALPDPVYPGNSEKLSQQDRARIAEIHYELLKERPNLVGAAQLDRLLPRWADGMLLSGGIGLFVVGLVVMFIRINQYANGKRDWI